LGKPAKKTKRSAFQNGARREIASLSEWLANPRIEDAALKEGAQTEDAALKEARE